VANAPIVTCPNCGTRNRIRSQPTGVPRCSVCHHALPWVVDADAESFDTEIVASVPVFVDFWAPWCAPCRAFAPVFAAAAARHPDILFAKVNTEEQQSLGAQFNIRSIPTLMIFRDDIIVYAEAGALPASALEQVVTQAKALDMDAVRRQIAAEDAGDGASEAPAS